MVALGADQNDETGACQPTVAASGDCLAKGNPVGRSVGSRGAGSHPQESRSGAAQRATSTANQATQGSGTECLDAGDDGKASSGSGAIEGAASWVCRRRS